MTGPTPRKLMLRPKSEISFREQDRGGGILPAARERPGYAYRQTAVATLLVHGFNVDKRSGRDAFESFTEHLPQAKRRNMFWIFWPGDVSSSTLLSVLGYPVTPDRARECAAKLSYFLSQELRASGRTRPVDLRIVAHSMGCLLALELVNHLQATRAFRIRLVALMAAAVPRYEVLSGGSLEMRRLAEEKVMIFRSYHDWVLGLAFRPGQIFERSWSSGLVQNRGALGFWGMGEGNLIAGKTLEFEKRLGHGDYWRAEDVAAQIAGDLPGPDRTMAGRSTRGRSTKGRGVAPRRAPGPR